MYLKLEKDNESYENYLKNSWINKCNSNFYKGIESDKFFMDLLEISDYSCYYCGQYLFSNNEKEIYYEKEHIINKKYDNYKNLILNKCKFNLIPVCKTCNSKKLSISMSDEFKENLNDLEIHCKNKTCDIHNSLEKMKDENFNPFAEDIKFDILHKVYFGNPKYIYQFKLNKRTKHIFQELFNFLYDIDYTFTNEEFLKKMEFIFKNKLDKELKKFLLSYNLISSSGTVDTFKIKNLIETITLLEEFD